MGETRMGQERSGVLYGLSAYFIWGLLPMYWKLLESVPAWEVLAHRVVWSLLFVCGLLGFLHKRRSKLPTAAAVLRERKLLGFTALGAVFISVNWGLFIYAVQADRIVEASLGYFINPLMVVLLGIVVLKESYSKWLGLAFVLAAAGVFVITASYGTFPWIALTMSASFAFYALIKKLIHIDSLLSLALETASAAPVALLFLTFLHTQGQGTLGTAGWPISVLLIGAGAATALPLLWFGMAAQRVTLATLGFMQYIGPTMNLIVGVAIYGEPFGTLHWIGFVCIWSALCVYTWMKVRVHIRPKTAGVGIEK